MRTPATGGPPALTHRARIDLVAGIYWHIPRSSAGVFAGASTVVWGLWGQLPQAVLFSWLGAICSILVWRLVLFKQYQTCMDKAGTVERWESRWTLSTGLHGSIWGSSAFLLYLPSSPEFQALLLIALFAICTAAVPLVGRHTPSMYAFVLPTLLPITGRLAIGGSAAQLLLATFSVLVMYGILLFGRELNRTIIESVQRRYENLDLIQQLTLQKARAEEARREADEANLMKSRFLAAASHDLRQPMHALGLFSASLRQRVTEPSAQAIVNHVCESVAALEQMFDTLLDLSRLEAGTGQTRRQSFALQPLFDRLHRECEPEASAKALSLHFVPTRAVVLSDAMLLERILRNLVVNAIRHTARGRVLVGCRRRGNLFRVEVWDTGPGIPEESRDLIFDDFYQVAASDTARQGLGLGLATVRRLSRLLGIQVHLQSRVGSGSVFAFEVPRSTSPAAAHPSAGGRFKDDGKLTGKIVVVIDDDPGTLEAMRDALNGWSAYPVAAQSVEEALAGLADCGRYPDGILSDYRLGPGCNGVQAIERIRDELGLSLPALIITGDTAAESLREIEASGNPWLSKPVTADRLHATLVRLLNAEAAEVTIPSTGGTVSSP